MLFCVLIRGLQNLESPFGKVLILFVRICCFRCADSRFGKPRCSLQRERFYSFRLYEKNGEYTRGLRTSGLRGRFKALSEKISAKFSDGTCRTRLFAKNGGEKALNRCDVPALQRKELERRLKKQRYSLVDSRLWLGGNLRCLWWKRVAWDGNKERFVQKNGFGFVKKAAFECS